MTIRLAWRTSVALLHILLALVVLMTGPSFALSIRRDSVPTLTSSDEIASFITPATFAADAYCTGLQVGSSVGKDGTVLWKAGNGDDLQMVYVAFSPSLGIVVAHQGTNRSSAASLANDIRFIRRPVDARLTELPSGASVADGFQRAWLDTADEVLEQVQLAHEAHPKANVTVTGHSLGAAIALLDALWIKQTLKSVTVNTVLFGTPRVGDQEFADAVDSLLPTQRHIIHARDPIPHMPFRTFGFRHASGQVWIPPSDTADDGDHSNDSLQAASALDCPGQENPACADSIKLPQYRLGDHDGPYFGVQMDCSLP